MKIKIVTRRLPRLLTIPGMITLPEYRDLQTGKICEIENPAADFLIRSGYAVLIPNGKKTTFDKEESKGVDE